MSYDPYLVSIESKRHAALLSAIRPFLRSRSLLALNFIDYVNKRHSNCCEDTELFQWLTSFLLETFPSSSVLDVLFDFLGESSRVLFSGFRLCGCVHVALALVPAPAPAPAVPAVYTTPASLNLNVRAFPLRGLPF